MTADDPAETHQPDETESADSPAGGVSDQAEAQPRDLASSAVQGDTPMKTHQSDTAGAAGSPPGPASHHAEAEADELDTVSADPVLLYPGDDSAGVDGPPAEALAVPVAHAADAEPSTIPGPNMSAADATESPRPAPPAAGPPAPHAGSEDSESQPDPADPEPPPTEFVSTDLTEPDGAAIAAATELVPGSFASITNETAEDAIPNQEVAPDAGASLPESLGAAASFPPAMTGNSAIPEEDVFGYLRRVRRDTASGDAPDDTHPSQMFAPRIIHVRDDAPFWGTVLGPVRLFHRRDGGHVPLAALTQSDTQYLLALLIGARNDGDPYDEDTLAELIFPGLPAEQRRRRIERLAWRTRSAMQSTPTIGWNDDPLPLLPSRVNLHPDLVHTDIELFRTSAAAARGYSDQPEQALAMWRSAFSLVQGVVLAGIDAEWAPVVRNHILDAIHQATIDAITMTSPIGDTQLAREFVIGDMTATGSRDLAAHLALVAADGDERLTNLLASP